MGLLRQYLAKLTPAFLLGGCSLLYNPSNIGKAPIDGQTIDVEMTADARIDAPPLADANPSMLTLEDVAPNIIFEGQGQGGSRAALVVIRGHHIIADGLSVSITPSTGLTLGTPTRSNNGDFIALPIAVAIDTNTNTGSTPLTITVTQNGGPQGGVALTGKLSVTYLPQFPTTTTIAASTLAPLYSEVNTTNNITITGDSSQPALIRSVSQIKLGNINVSGANGGTGSSVAAGGPGGCPGGAGGSTGGCTQNDGGGGGGAGNAGGGGGGFASAGGGGNGAGGGAAGVMHGTAQLVAYTGPDGMKNQSAGGGGGGAQTLSSQGAGGGGGGTLELTAGGNIEVGTITANGGKGGDAGTLITGAGGGGGGSGGVVVVRSDAGTVAFGSISASGGAAGAPAGSGGGGGMGAPGRVRIDVASGTPSATNPASHRGPSFAGNTPTIVTGETNILTLFGATDDVVDAYVIDADDQPHFGEPMNLKFGGSGTLMVTPVLLPGYNRLCVTLRPGTRGDALADKCIDIAYLP